MKRTLGIAMLIVCASMLLGACGGHSTTDADRLRAAMARTAALPRQLVYSDVTTKGRVEVRAIVADDFRYKASAAVNSAPVWEEVVSDDALADRALSDAGFGLFARHPAIAAAGAAQAASSTAPVVPTSVTPEVQQALVAHQWVLDPAGAPSLLPSADEHHALGDDPIFDALTVFRYVETAIEQSPRVHVFNAEALDYKPADDPFPKPKKGSGVIRFDFDRPRLPRPQDLTGATANQAIPSTAQFRKMAVYVKNGLVVQVLEQIDVASRLADLQRLYNVKIPATLPTAKRVEIAIDAINAVRVAQGSDPIRVRTMSLQLLDIGKPESIALPTDAVQGSLAVFENRGHLSPAATTATSS